MFGNGRWYMYTQVTNLNGITSSKTKNFKDPRLQSKQILEYNFIFLFLSLFPSFFFLHVAILEEKEMMTNGSDGIV